VEVLKQGRADPVEVAHQVCILYAVTNGYLDNIDLKNVRAYEEDLYDYLNKNYLALLEEIRTTKVLSKENEQKLQEALKDFGKNYQ
jgi:F-type H+-transporting ATPase subunit alpha